VRSAAIGCGMILGAALLGLLTGVGSPVLAHSGTPSIGVDEAQSRYQFVVNHNSGKCLDVWGASTSENARTVQRTCERGRHSQQWSLERMHDGYLQFRNRGSGLCLDKSPKPPPRGRVVQKKCDREKHSQHWRRDRVEDRFDQLVHEGKESCVDVKGASMADDADVVLSKCDRDRRSQHWRLRTTLPAGPGQ
jgi:hypothetical protein